MSIKNEDSNEEERKEKAKIKKKCKFCKIRRMNEHLRTCLATRFLLTLSAC